MSLGSADGLVAQRPPTGEGAEVFRQRFGVFDGIDYHGVGVLRFRGRQRT